MLPSAFRGAVRNAIHRHTGASAVSAEGTVAAEPIIVPRPPQSRAGEEHLDEREVNEVHIVVIIRIECGQAAA